MSNKLCIPGNRWRKQKKKDIPGYWNVVDEKDRKILYRNISAGQKGDKPVEVGITRRESGRLSPW